MLANLESDPRPDLHLQPSCSSWSPPGCPGRTLTRWSRRPRWTPGRPGPRCARRSAPKPPRARPAAGRGRAGRGLPPGTLRGAARAGLRAAGAARRERPPRARPPGLLTSTPARSASVYETGDGVLLLVATDRISAFDHVLPTPIPDKGKILTQLSLWWFEQLADAGAEPPGGRGDPGRVRRPGHGLPQAVHGPGGVRGPRLPGRVGLREYRATGAVCGVPLPAGLTEGSQLPEPIFTPATKAPRGRARREHHAVRGGRGGRRGRRRRAGADHPGGVPAGRGHGRPAAASSWPTPRSSSASTRPGGCCWPTRC